MMIITAPRSASMDDKREGFVRESLVSESFICETMGGHYCAASAEKMSDGIGGGRSWRTRT
jgi:hypothetical protein